jgi:hypothetical protein
MKDMLACLIVDQMRRAKRDDSTTVGVGGEAGRRGFNASPRSVGQGYPCSLGVSRRWCGSVHGLRLLIVKKDAGKFIGVSFLQRSEELNHLLRG